MMGLVLIVIGVLLYFQFTSEKQKRQELYTHELDLVCQRIINAYETGQSLHPYIQLLREYYTEYDNMFDDIWVCVYNQNGDLMYNVGPQVLQDFAEVANESSERAEDLIKKILDRQNSGGDDYMIRYRRSADDKISVVASIPLSVSVLESLSVSKQTWIVPIVILILAFVVCVFSTRYLTKSINLLSEFASKAGDSNEELDHYEFPHDELGDISRQIIKLYQERMDAVKRSEREHQIALHAVEEKARLKRELTNNINHELKTPIGVIKGYLDTIMSTPDMPPATRERFMLRTQENVERLCNLLNDVSSMTRLEDGSGNVPVTAIDFHDLVFTIENDLSVSGLSGNMKFVYNIPLNCVVKGNAHLLSGMISNLIKNAAIHSHGTEMGLKLVVESEKYYTFSFYDNGTGVEPQHLAHLFERFYRIDAGRARKSGGTGLGLPIVKNTVEALGGTISVHNRAGGGLEFLFTLEKWVGRVS